jgi:hypothetical protein
MSKTTPNWDYQIDRLIAHANKEAYTVSLQRVFDGESNICFDEKHIKIHSGHTKERQFYLLLHELGHMTLRKGRKGYSQSIEYAYKNFSDRSKANKIAVVEEEYKAWEEGYKLAKRKRLFVDRSNFQKIKTECLQTYFVWAI